MAERRIVRGEPSLPDYYGTLESKPADSLSDIRQRYMRLSRAHHPDKQQKRQKQQQLQQQQKTKDEKAIIAAAAAATATATSISTAPAVNDVSAATTDVEFCDLAQAWSVLSNPQKRSRYDAERKSKTTQHR